MQTSDPEDKTLVSRACSKCGEKHDADAVCPDTEKMEAPGQGSKAGQPTTIPEGGDSRQDIQPSDQLKIGEIFAGRFQIIAQLGEGGMGLVYKAQQTFLKQFVAVKLLNHSHVANPQMALRFQQEGRTASSLDHANVAKILDFGISERGQPYLIMDFVEGESLDKVLNREKTLSVARFIPLFTQVCSALAHAHEHGIIHRDLKPSNIMVGTASDGTDQIKLVDFGIAKIIYPSDESQAQALTGTGELFGSPYYMSPEQCSGRTLDTRSDIYSLGCVMYQCLTGCLPHAGKNAYETMSQHISHDIAAFYAVRPDLDFPPNLEKTVLKAVERDPDFRFQSMTALKDALSTIKVPQQHVSGQRKNEQPANQISTWKLVRNWSKKIVHRKQFVGPLAIILAVAIFFFAWHERTQHIVLLECVSPGDEALLTQNYKEALADYTRGLEEAEKPYFGEDTIILVLDRLGLYYQQRGLPREAEAAFQRALSLRQQLLDHFSFVKPTEQNVAINRDNLAVQLIAEGKLTEAQSQLLDALKTFEKLQNQQHANPERYANCLKHYAALLKKQGDRKQAVAVELHAQQLEAK